MNLKAEYQNARITEFMKRTGCLTRHVARIYLEAEEWDIDEAVVDWESDSQRDGTCFIYQKGAF